MTAQITWVLLAALALAGAAVVVLGRELTRMMLGLGAFLLGLAGLYAFLGFGMLAVAHVFLYVGGVLVLFVFAITSIGRDEEGRSLSRSLDVGSAVVAIAVGVMIAASLWTVMPTAASGSASVGRTAEALLGPLLPHFEILGVLLLAALAAALAIVGGGEEQ